MAQPLPSKWESPGPADAVAPPVRRRIWPRILLGIALTLFIVAGGTAVYLKKSVDLRLEHAVAAAARDNPGWEFDKLLAAREPVPDAENSARVVAKVATLFPKAWPFGPAPPPGAPKPPPTELSKAFDKLRGAENVRLDDATVNTLRDELEKYHNAVELARTLANYTRGRSELVVGPAVTDTDLPETGRAYDVARLLWADAAIRAQDGDVDGALESGRAILGAARSIGDEPFLLSQLTRVAIGSTAMRAVRRALAHGEPSDRAMARFQAEALDEMGQPLLRRAVQSERASLTEQIRRVGTGEVSRSQLFQGAPRPGQADRRPVASAWHKLRFDYQRAVAIEWMNEAVAITRLVPTERHRRWKAREAEVARRAGNLFSRLAEDILIVLYPSLSGVDTACTRSQCELGATALLLAAERQRRRTGEWPESIGRIDPAILPRPPLDPYSGRPFHVDRRDGRLVVYSVGLNLKAERGAYDPKGRSESGHLDDVNAVGWDVDLRRHSTSPAGS